MSESSEQNHYAALGVERSADLRAIKKAYFALVRQFPPESHPEEFKRIRAAYEVLSDAEARERYDEQEKGYREYEDDVAALLGAAEAAAAGGDEAAAQTLLREAIEAHPDVLLLREKLVASLARAKEHEAGLAAIDEMLERSPDTARYHFLRALALRALDRFGDAEEALRRAHELAPEDEAIEDALVNVLVRNDHADEALELLDRAAERCDPGGPKAIGVQLRRVHALYQANQDVEAEEAVLDLVRLARASDDPEVPRLVATELGLPAASLFAMDRVGRANRLLASCHVLHPESPVLRPYPSKITLDTAALPRRALAWLREREEAPDGPTLRATSSGLPLWALAGAGLLGLVSYLLVDHAREPAVGDSAPWAPPAPFAATVAGALVLAVLVWGACTFVATFVRAVIVQRSALLRGLTTTHPLYLIRADAERVELYPLFCLTRSEGVHHSQNGVYTYTALALGFGEHTVRLTFRDAGFAQAWLDHLIASRKRALELLAAGYLDAEHGVDLLPPAVLAEKVARRPRRWWTERRWLLGVAAATLGLWAGTMVSGRRHVEALAFREAVARDAVPAYDAYLRAYPEGRFSDEARRARLRKLERETDAPGLALDGRAPGADAMGGLVRALAEAGARDVPMRIAIADRAPILLGGLGEVPGELLADLAATLAQAGVRSARTWRPDAVKQRSPGEPGAIEIDCALTQARADGKPDELSAAWVVRVIVAGAETHRFAITTSAVVRGEGPRGALKAMSADLLSKLLADLGLRSAEGARRLNAKHTGSSPYGN